MFIQPPESLRESEPSHLSSFHRCSRRTPASLSFKNRSSTKAETSKKKTPLFPTPSHNPFSPGSRSSAGWSEGWSEGWSAGSSAGRRESRRGNLFDDEANVDINSSRTCSYDSTDANSARTRAEAGSLYGMGAGNDMGGLKLLQSERSNELFEQSLTLEPSAASISPASVLSASELSIDIDLCSGSPGCSEGGSGERPLWGSNVLYSPGSTPSSRSSSVPLLTLTYHLLGLVQSLF